MIESIVGIFSKANLVSIPRLSVASRPLRHCKFQLGIGALKLMNRRTFLVSSGAAGIGDLIAPDAFGQTEPTGCSTPHSRLIRGPIPNNLLSWQSQQGGN